MPNLLQRFALATTFALTSLLPNNLYAQEPKTDPKENKPLISYELSEDTFDSGRNLLEEYGKRITYEWGKDFEAHKYDMGDIWLRDGIPHHISEEDIVFYKEYKNQEDRVEKAFENAAKHILKNSPFSFVEKFRSVGTTYGDTPTREPTHNIDLIDEREAYDTEIRGTTNIGRFKNGGSHIHTRFKFGDIKDGILGAGKLEFRMENLFDEGRFPIETLKASITTNGILSARFQTPIFPEKLNRRMFLRGKIETTPMLEGVEDIKKAKAGIVYADKYKRFEVNVFMEQVEEEDDNFLELFRKEREGNNYGVEVRLGWSF